MIFSKLCPFLENHLEKKQRTSPPPLLFIWLSLNETFNEFSRLFFLWSRLTTKIPKLRPLRKANETRENMQSATALWACALSIQLGSQDWSQISSSRVIHLFRNNQAQHTINKINTTRSLFHQSNNHQRLTICCQFELWWSVEMLNWEGRSM